MPGLPSSPYPTSSPPGLGAAYHHAAQRPHRGSRPLSACRRRGVCARYAACPSGCVGTRRLACTRPPLAPPPRVVPSHDATAEWHHRWCGHCRHFCAVLRARAALPVGGELTVPRPLTPNPDDGLWPFELTFDGGARRLGGRPKVAGGGAILWRFPPTGEAPLPCASLVLALPSCDDSMLGEAHAGCQGLSLLLSPVLPAGPRSARVVGDNLPVVRFGAASGRLRRVPQHAPLAETLGAVLAAGWQLTWNGVRRRYNEGADSLATLGALWADRLLQAGVGESQVHIVWHDQNPPAPPPSFPPVPPHLSLDDLRPCLDRLLAAAAAEARAARGGAAH